ncbi:MAG: glycosyltransferase [Deltaproteobacteria bacterium]|nr:glycosyltransferase [Deltaproteobacteria bacterium]
MTKISIILPIFNEANGIEPTLYGLQPFRAEGHEVIVVDGGSRDDSALLSIPLADRVITAERSRSRQMNAGAEMAKGDILLFLHGDTFLPKEATQRIIHGIEKKGRNWGRFDVRLSGKHPILRAVELFMNWRSRLTGIATGDQAIFVRRDLFESIGGFPEISLMEDIALSKILKRYGPPLCLRERVLTSSRRWENNGVIRTIFHMWYLRLAYFMGADPNHLALMYRPTR